MEKIMSSRINIGLYVSLLTLVSMYLCSDVMLILV